MCLSLGVPVDDRDSDIEQLEHKLSDYRVIIGQQEELIQVSFFVVCTVCIGQHSVKLLTVNKVLET